MHYNVIFESERVLMRSFEITQVMMEADIRPSDDI